MCQIEGPAAGGALYVGDLHPQTTEADLYHLFSKAAPVSSVRVVRDPVTRRSKCYAYVNFQPGVTDATVRSIVESLRYTELHGARIRVMEVDRDIRKRRGGNVYIKGLRFDVDEKALNDVFEAYGKVLSVSIVRAEDGSSLGYGYVQFAEPSDADVAIGEVDGMVLSGQRVEVSMFKGRDERGEGGKETLSGNTNVFVKCIPKSVRTEADLVAMFARFGQITSSHLAMDNFGNLKGFGFVNFTSLEDAMQAINEMNGICVDGSQLYVAAAQTKFTRRRALTEKQPSSTPIVSQGLNLYVKNLPLEMGDEGLNNLFEKFGKIISAKVMLDNLGRSRGFGFVCFAAPEAANEALLELNGLRVSRKPLVVSVALPREQRQMMLQQHRFQGFLPPFPFPCPPSSPAAMHPPMPPFYSHPQMYPWMGVHPCYASQPGMVPVTAPLPMPIDSAPAPAAPVPAPVVPAPDLENAWNNNNITTKVK